MALKRVFHKSQNKFYGADSMQTYTQADGTVVTMDMDTGSYMEQDGTWYDSDGDPLSYYDPSTGNYVIEGDPNGTLYDANGNPVNSPGSASSGTPAPKSSSPSFFTNLLNGIAGSIGKSTTPTSPGGITPLYSPTVSTGSTGGLIVAVVAIGLVTIATVYVIRKTKKGGITN